MGNSGEGKIQESNWYESLSKCFTYGWKWKRGHFPCRRQIHCVILAFLSFWNIYICIHLKTKEYSGTSFKRESLSCTWSNSCKREAQQYSLSAILFGFSTGISIGLHLQPSEIQKEFSLIWVAAPGIWTWAPGELASHTGGPSGAEGQIKVGSGREAVQWCPQHGKVALKLWRLIHMPQYQSFTREVKELCERETELLGF